MAILNNKNSTVPLEPIYSYLFEVSLKDTNLTELEIAFLTENVLSLFFDNSEGSVIVKFNLSSIDGELRLLKILDKLPKENNEGEKCFTLVLNLTDSKGNIIARLQLRETQLVPFDLFTHIIDNIELFDYSEKEILSHIDITFIYDMEKIKTDY